MTATSRSSRSDPGNAPAPLLSTDLAADVVRARALRRMRWVAGGLLLLAALVYLATLNSRGAWGFVNAGAEAAMVGAMADWFAVTALFRHPLGLPIPHTALIPRRKDDLGRGLQEFVGDNFLAETVIRERVTAAQITARVARWLSADPNARRVVDEVSELAAVALSKVRDEHITELVSSALLPRLADEPLAPLAGTLLTEVVRDDLHHPAVDLLLDEAGRWLVEHEETFLAVLTERAPWWTPGRVNTAVTRRLHAEALRWIDDVRADPRHSVRSAIDSMLEQLAHDLLEDPDTQARCERFKDRVLTHPQIAQTAVSLWQALRHALLASLRDPAGALRERAATELVLFARGLSVDPELQRRIDRRAADATVFMVERYGAEVTGVITHTIEQWDGREAANRIELYVGRDLQFIRINGTVVGGLVGVLIHTVSLLLA